MQSPVILPICEISVWHIPLLCVQWETPDDGQRNCPKHVEFYSKNKFDKWVHLVGFIIRIIYINYLFTFAGSLGASVHPMLTVTQTSYSCHEVLEKKSTDSSPSHSQVSRNSSRKSNNSLLVTNGKLEGK